MFPIMAGNSASTGYNLTRSLRFRASASAYLNRTNVGTVTNSAVWTWSGWVKLGYWSPGNAAVLFGNGNGGSNECTIKFTNNQLEVINYASSTVQARRITTAVFRDPSAWYHIVVASNSSTALNIYVNGVQITSFGTSTGPSAAAWALNTASTATNIGFATGLVYFDGEMAEVNFIDGQALTPSSFGSTNALTGVWQPARYTGTYGTNGFYLPFTDNSALTTSSNVGLGKDFSGNANYWVTNNISITAGVTYDSMTDVPTLTSATAANFAVLNPVDKASGVTTSNANLRATTGTAYDEVRATLAVSTKNYFEVTNSGTPSGSYAFLAGFQITQLSLSAVSAARANEFRIISRSTTDVQSGTTTLFSPTAVGNGEVIQFAIDVAAGKAWIRRASAWYNSTGGTTVDPATGANPTFTFTATEVYAVVGGYSVDLSFNAGQRPFTYTPPTGYVALNTYNLPTSTIVKGSDNMNIALAAGASIKSTTEALFSGQFLEWIKDRANVNNHQLLNGVTGLSAVLQSNTTAAETTYSAPSGNSVGWAWKAGSSSSSNTSGTIASTVSVNASAGFSVVTFTGNGTAGATVGHGLGVAPAFIVVKQRNATQDWMVGSSSLASWNQYLILNNAQQEAGSVTVWNNTVPTSSVFSLGNSATTNGNTNTYVAYCWTPIAGFSAFGSYTGNGSADGPFVYTGFRPKFVMIKRKDAVSALGWFIYDTATSTYNFTRSALIANSSASEQSPLTEGSGAAMDVVSNGFKPRGTYADINASGGTYLYMAFAENPFKNSLGR